MKPTIKLVNSVYGKVRILENFKPYKLYIRKQRNQYYIIDDLSGGIDAMVSINGIYWFRTLKELKKELDI